MQSNNLKRYLTVLAYVMLVAGFQFWNKFHPIIDPFQASENQGNVPIPKVEVIPQDPSTDIVQQPLNIEINSPLNNMEVSDTIDLSAGLGGDQLVDSVIFLINDQKVIDFQMSPFLAKYDTKALPDGEYKFTVRAQSGETATEKSINFLINNSIIDTQNPQITYITPVERPTIWSGATSLPIEVTASDNRTIKRLDIYINDALVFPKKNEHISGTSNVAHVKISWPAAGVAVGDYVIKTRAYDFAGNMAQESLRVIRSSFNY
ncbi:MAG: Ig-like domain-containing protein [bacterium]